MTVRDSPIALSNESPTAGTVRRRVGRPPDSDAAETWARIIVAARERFGQNGYHATSVKEIAGQAGVTSGAVYYYCRSKRALFAAVIEDTWKIVEETTSENMHGRVGFVRQMNAFLETAAYLQETDPT